MADTTDLLPQLPVASAYTSTSRSSRTTSPFSGRSSTVISRPILPDGAETVHYPVLVPNMRGLDNLLKLEGEWRLQGGQHRLTDEIAVFVSATEVWTGPLTCGSC